jgi:hypothetical protein
VPSYLFEPFTRFGTQILDLAVQISDLAA